MIRINSEYASIRRRIRENVIAKTFASIATWLLAIAFIALIVFVAIKSIPGFQAYGFKGIFMSDQYNSSEPELHEASVWLPLAVTCIITVGSLIIATPLALKTATFIHFRIKKESIKKTLKIIIESSAAIPSVVFGLFAYKSLGPVVKNIFGLSITNTVLTTIFMMALMLVPTILLLTINAFSAVDQTLITNSMSLANGKTRSIYKIFRKQTRKQITVAVIIAAGRVIGETMAVSMILSSENYTNVFNNGFFAILSSSLRPLGAVISKGMFAENGGDQFRGLLFAFGITMFIFVMILNCLVIAATNASKTRNLRWWKATTDAIGGFILLIPNQISYLFNRFVYKQHCYVTKDNYNVELSSYLQERITKNKTIYIYDYYKQTWEYVDSIFVFGMIAWIILDILFKGLYAISQPSSTLFMYSKDTTGQAVVNTLLLILVIIVISLPISLLIAIWLNEYSRGKKTKKIILFFVDSIGATPSIIFGMFGLALFIEILHISANGPMGNSLLAGALTMVIVILPTFTRMNQQALQAVPKEIRENSYALGNSKWYTIKSLVLPHAYRGILSSIILTIGRILAETAPLFITAGLSSASTVALMNPSQTLTTRIYAQLNGSSSALSTNIMYESAIIALVLIFALIVIGYVVIPNWNSIKNDLKTRWAIQMMIWKQNKATDTIESYKTQIQKSTLYLTAEQAEKLNVENNHIWLYKDEFIKTEIISEYKMTKMEKNYLRLNNKIK